MNLLKDHRTLAESLLQDEVNDYKVGETVYTKQYGRKGTVKAIDGTIVQVDLAPDESNSDIGSVEGGIRHFHFAALRR